MKLSSLRIGVIGTAEMPEYLVKNLRLVGLNTTLIPFKRLSLYKYLMKVEVVIFVFPINKLQLIRRAKIAGKITIAKWIGSDVLFALGERKGDLKRFLKYIDIHITDSPLLKEELLSEGIRSILIPIVPPDLKVNLKPLPDEPSFLTYIIPEKEDFYRAEIIGNVAKRIKYVKFYVVENGRVPSAPDNVHHLGLIQKLDMEGVYERSTAFLRLTLHDGISMSVLEALSYGRYVIRSIPFPACLYAVSEDEIVRAIEMLIDVKEINKEGIDFIERVVSPGIIAEAWYKLFNNLSDVLHIDNVRWAELEKFIDVM
ncbi:MAG: hypothetical protein ACUVWP_06855 [bacterium]